MTVTAKALVALLCVLLTLPPGWCCLLPLPVASCCKRPVTPVATAPKTCCCCTEHTPETPAPAPAPSAPRLCCCEHYPATPPEAPFTLDAPTITAVAPCLVTALATHEVASAVVALSPPVFPRRHVLLCVWTC